MITTKTKLIIISIFLALLTVAGFVATKLEAIAPGGSCENSSQRGSCSGPGAACISAEEGDDYCSIECTAASDCPASMRCEEIDSETYSAKDGTKVKSQKVKMCVRP